MNSFSHSAASVVAAEDAGLFWFYSRFTQSSPDTSAQLELGLRTDIHSHANMHILTNAESRTPP